MKPQEINIEYDETNHVNLGKPKHFDPEEYCDVVEQMVASDELIRAIQMLDNPPAYYRMYPTTRMIGLKKKLMKNSASLLYYIGQTPETYESSLKHENACNPERNWTCVGEMIDAPFTQPRSQMIQELVKELNDKGETPQIVEFGPSNFWLPHGLHRKGLKFTYFAESLHKEAMQEAEKMLKEKNVWFNYPEAMKNREEAPEIPIIFVCFETLEHLWDETDILKAYYRYNIDADYIMFSTPCCTLFGGLPDMNRTIEHLRSYTPNEVLNLLFKWWPDHQWNFTLSNMMTFKGSKMI